MQDEGKNACTDKKFLQEKAGSMKKKISFEIFRYKTENKNTDVFQNYSIDIDENMTVLDCLDFIRINIDSTLVYRCSCHHSCCGTCAMRINGREKLACITPALSLSSSTIKLEPLNGLKKICDLAVDMKYFYNNFPDDLNYLVQSKSTGKINPYGIFSFTRFENCIECGSCVSACPAAQKKNNFLGPAVLAAINNEIKKNPFKSKELLKIAQGETGVEMCIRAIECSRVCPTRVYPAKHIKELMEL
jgi:succinate dehydrogenase / fumarate reductase, iron-sulfur subunit